MKRITKKAVEIANVAVFHRNAFWDAMGELEDALEITIDEPSEAFNALAGYVTASDLEELVKECQQ